MDILLFYNIIIYLILRSAGFGISLDFYHKTRQDRFKLGIVGWGLWILASILSIISSIISNEFMIEFLLFLNSFFVAIATIFYIWMIFSYFLKVNSKIFIGILGSLSTVLLIAYLVAGHDLAINLAVTIVSMILLSVFIVPAWYRKEFKEGMGMAAKWYFAFLISLAFYLVISIYISSQGLGYYGVYSEVNAGLVLLNYVPSIIYYVILIVLIIHVEYNYSHRKASELKDKYSHNLGNILQFISGFVDLSSQMDEDVEKELLEMRDIFKKKCKEASGLIREIREL